jgi:dTMP kinase
MQGTFITLEGGEGVGKSTMMTRIDSWLRGQGQSVLTTREPGGTDFAEEIRRILLHPGFERLDRLTELLLVFASRAQHLQERIRPALARGDVVLCDRFTDATWAYQGGGSGVPEQQIAVLEQLVHGDLQPDLTLLLDMPVEAGLRRALDRSAADRFEKESLDFFERVRNAYLERAASEPGRFVVIDAEPGVDEVWAQIEETLVRRVVF